MNKYSQNKSAFTLVELSIVLVVIGLLAAAVLTGNSLIQGAESKALLSEVQKLNASIVQFQSLYKGMPGDLPNAQSYWQSAASNGNGSGQVDEEPSNEPFLAIQELYLANLLEGSFQGFSGAWGGGFVLSNSSTTGNVVGAKGRASAALYIKCCSATDYSRTLNFNNHITLFSLYSGDNTKRAGIVTPIEAYDMDKKVDDGVPDTGLVGASGSWTGSAYAATGCYSGVGASSQYNASVSADKELRKCQMMFGYDWN